MLHKESWFSITAVNLITGPALSFMFWLKLDNSLEEASTILVLYTGYKIGYNSLMFIFLNLLQAFQSDTAVYELLKITLTDQLISYSNYESQLVRNEYSSFGKYICFMFIPCMDNYTA